MRAGSSYGTISDLSEKETGNDDVDSDWCADYHRKDDNEICKNSRKDSDSSNTNIKKRKIKQKNVWNCTACTYENISTSLSCEICNRERNQNDSSFPNKIWKRLGDFQHPIHLTEEKISAS